MEVINFDLTELWVGDFNPTTGAVTNEVKVAVYKNTFDLVDNDLQSTPIFQAGVASPKRNLISGDNAEVAVFNIMDTSAASKLFWLGGTVVTVNGVDTWNKPKGTPKEMIKSIRAVTGDGSIMKMPRGSVVAKKDFKARDTDIYIMPIRVTATDTGVALVPNFSMTDPTPAV